MNEQEKQVIWEQGFIAFQEHEGHIGPNCPYDDETEEEKFNAWFDGYECAEERLS